MLKTKRSGDIATGAALAILGLVAALASISIGEGAGGHLHPRTFPMLLGVLMIIGGGGLAIFAARDRTATKKIDWPDRRGWKTWLMAMASLVLFVALTPVLGFLLCIFLFVGGFILYFGRYALPVALGWSLGVTVFIYLVFIRLLDLTLPMGPLGFLS
ncbi:MAG: tripartite tricarboxylate transporter TctB family protein [Desulfobacteraceae bacterium]|nr:MAG: tripartite tricarboxylate transporter TctB family protein [Desulfobacteraceae bacterium]